MEKGTFAERWGLPLGKAALEGAVRGAAVAGRVPVEAAEGERGGEVEAGGEPREDAVGDGGDGGAEPRPADAQGTAPQAAPAADDSRSSLQIKPRRGVDCRDRFAEN